MLPPALVSVIDAVAANMAGAKSRAAALRRHGCRVFIIIASALRQLRFTITTIVNLTYHKYSVSEFPVNNTGRPEPWYLVLFIGTGSNKFRMPEKFPVALLF